MSSDASPGQPETGVLPRRQPTAPLPTDSPSIQPAVGATQAYPQNLPAPVPVPQVQLTPCPQPPQYGTPAQPQPAYGQPPYTGPQQPGYGAPATVVHVHQQMVRGKDTGIAYLLWFFLGLWGLHKFYLGNPVMGILYIFTCGLFGIGMLIDLFTIPAQVRAANQREMRGY